MLIFVEFCPDVSPDKTVDVNWIYAVEFFPNITEKQLKESMLVLELKLVSDVLHCNTSLNRKFFRHRHLFSDGIAGLDYMPMDTLNEDLVCFSNSTVGGVCRTYFGQMVLYLEEDMDDQVAMSNMLYIFSETSVFGIFSWFELFPMFLYYCLGMYVNV